VEVKLFATVFITIFLAELGDKTQLATLLYASDAENPRLTVFAASALALISTSAIGVLAGSAVSQFINPQIMGRVAGGLFIVIGCLTIWKA
jgi:putative Ca2+/H+ antiporter (TMEM165/GDT1 family)